MKLPSIIAIYALFWTMSAFLVMPFGVRTHEEAGTERVPGQADSAPHEFRPLRLIGRTTVLATILFVIFYANYTYGWVTSDMIKRWGDPRG